MLVLCSACCRSDRVMMERMIAELIVACCVLQTIQAAALGHSILGGVLQVRVYSDWMRQRQNDGVAIL